MALRVVIAIAGVGALVAAASARSSSGRQLSRYGLSVVLPSGWTGSIALGAGPGGLPVVRAAKPPHASLLISEVGNRPGTNGFDPVRLPLRLRTKHRWRFAYGGRSFAISMTVSTPARSDARRVLASVRIAPVSTPQIWAGLRRPLHLPQVGRQRTCPRARRAHVSATVGFPIGGGPVYVGLGSAGGFADLADDIRRGGRALHKTLWAIDPRYRGPLVVRGRRLDRSGLLRFSFGRRFAPELHFARDYLQRRGWRYGPSTTAVPGPGCYAFQVDGRGFSEVISFQARR